MNTDSNDLSYGTYLNICQLQLTKDKLKAAMVFSPGKNVKIVVFWYENRQRPQSRHLARTVTWNPVVHPEIDSLRRMQAFSRTLAQFSMLIKGAMPTDMGRMFGLPATAHRIPPSEEA